MSWEYINVNPNPATVCPMCEPFVGIIFEHKKDGPPLPAHFHCFCSYMITDAEPTFEGWDWDNPDLPNGTKRRWIQELARRIRDGEVPPIPPFLLPLFDLAKKYNEEEYKPRPKPESEEELMEERQQLVTGRVQLQRKTPRRYTVNFVTSGVNANGWEMPLAVLRTSLSQFSGVPCLLNHSDLWTGADITRWAATHENPVLTRDGINTTLRIHDTEAGNTLQRIFNAWLSDREAGLEVSPIGISADLSIRWKPRDDYEAPYIAAKITKVWSGDAVLHPAAGGEVQHILNSITPGGTMSETENPIAPPHAIPTPAITPATVETVDLSELHLQLDIVSQAVQRLEQRLTRQDEDATVQDNGRTNLRASVSSLDEVQAAIDWLAGVKNVPTPAPYLRRLDNIYQLTTGDVEWHGVYRPQRVSLASANESTLPAMLVDAMNKVIVNQYALLAPYRWYEQIVTVAPNDGTLQDAKWLTYGGISTLPDVPYGAEYPELAVSDSKESDSFAVKGGYVGITRKVLRNSDIVKLQAIPVQLTNASIRTRSAKIANLLTGTGPTLNTDSKSLFHADHNNLAATAFSTAAWEAASLELYNQTELGSDSKLALRPRYWFGPAALHKAARIAFGYGSGAGGYPGTANNDVNPHAADFPGAPRPLIITVPEFTSATNWGYLADPHLFQVLMMTYAQNPGGRTHPMPELFQVTSPLAGMMFTKDTLPIKARDEYACGVAGYRGIGKRNVA